MKTSAKMIMMSHLSDVQQMETFDFVDPRQQEENSKQINTKLNFVKYMIDQLLDGRLDNTGQPMPNHIEVDPDEMWAKFTEKDIH